MWNDRQTGERPKFCTTIITEPNAFVAEIHDRMPALQGMRQLRDAANLLRLFQFQLTR
jgi:putative SOS response-associated peptidase YedK